MIAELTELQEAQLESRLEFNVHAQPPLRRVNALPSGLVFTEAAIAALRADLVAHGREDWEIFQTDMEFWGITRYAAPNGAWRPLPALSGGEPMQKLDEYSTGIWRTPTGVLHVEAFDCILARWLLVEPVSGYVRGLRLIAAPSIEHVERLLAHVREQAAAQCSAVWQIVHGSYVNEQERPPRKPVEPESLILDETILQRLEREAIGFFNEPVAELYRKLRVPLRRGILLYGPPGNGKTSTIRWLGGRLPKVAALLLRPGDGFGTDELLAALDQWKSQAPAMLVIEDLNWLLAKIDVSQFLNALDGIETPQTRGLLLIASTNHPDRLDPALSNRPGRFDVTIEVPLPDEHLRRRYLTTHLPGTIEEADLAQFIELSEGLSFAHLGEVLRLSGMAVIAEGRSERTRQDLLDAFEIVRDANRAAERGFSGPVPKFGLQTLVRPKA